MTQEQFEQLARQADAQRAAAARAADEAKRWGLKGAQKLEHIAKAIEQAAKDSSQTTFERKK